MCEGAPKEVPNDGKGVRTVRVRAVCLVAHQRTNWSGPSRALCGGSRIAAAFARACEDITRRRRQSSPSALVVTRTLITQIQFFQRHCAKHIRIADATLRKFDDFLGDNSCRWVVTNFQMQSLTNCYEGG